MTRQIKLDLIWCRLTWCLNPHSNRTPVHQESQPAESIYTHLLFHQHLMLNVQAVRLGLTFAFQTCDSAFFSPYIYMYARHSGHFPASLTHFIVFVWLRLCHFQFVILRDPMGSACFVWSTQPPVTPFARVCVVGQIPGSPAMLREISLLDWGPPASMCVWLRRKRKEVSNHSKREKSMKRWDIQEWWMQWNDLWANT